MTIREEVGERIRLARKKSGLSQYELADKSGIQRSRINNWENGIRLPGPQEMLLMAKHLDVSPSWLYCLTDTVGQLPIAKGSLQLIPVFSYKDISKGYKEPLKAFQNLDQHHFNVSKLIALSPATKGNYGKSSFAVVIEDDSMQPELAIGDIMIINPELPPTPGKYVLAKLSPKNEVLIRKFRSPKAGTIELVSCNNDWPNHQDTNDNSTIEIIGTVVQLQRNV